MTTNLVILIVPGRIDELLVCSTDQDDRRQCKDAEMGGSWLPIWRRSTHFGGGPRLCYVSST